MYRLHSAAYEKVWGTPRTEPWHPSPGDQKKIGEVWWTDTPALPLLYKFLFTSEKLSVQVHPEDDFAHRHEAGSRGKTEMWRILRADPGASIALGFKQTISRDTAIEAARSGAIEELLHWIPVSPGDLYFVPAGTVHAIGAGLALCEVQQNSDVTYRLYDYGRPRELHLDKGFAVADLGPYDGKRAGEIRCPFFHVEELTFRGTFTLRDPASLLILEGEGLAAGLPFRAGEAWRHAPSHDPLVLESNGAVTLLRVNEMSSPNP